MHFKRFLGPETYISRTKVEKSMLILFITSYRLSEDSQNSWLAIFRKHTLAAASEHTKAHPANGVQTFGKPN